MLVCNLNTRDSGEMFRFQLLTEFDGYNNVVIFGVWDCFLRDTVSTDIGCSCKHDVNVAEWTLITIIF